MLTEYEAQKLQADVRRETHVPAKQRLLRDMRREPAWRLGGVLKCAVCVLFLAGLALIGTSTNLQSGAPFGTPAADGSEQYRERASVVETKKAFEGVAESERKPPLVSERPQNAGENYAGFKAEYRRKAVFDERRRTWEQRRYDEDKRIASVKDAP